MSNKKITGRELRHETPEENLSPGESVTVEKRSGKVFELTRVDSGERSITAELDRLLSEMPSTGPECKMDTVQIFLEDRE